MKILIVEPCGYMRLGMLSVLTKNRQIEVVDVDSLEKALVEATNLKPDIILANMTSHCHSTQTSCNINNFLKLRTTSRIYCYLDANYPESDEPITIAENFLILKKQMVNSILHRLNDLASTRAPLKICTQPYSIYSDQEILVMNDWMAEVPNYRIAKKLNISDRTVYVHKRHITQKIKVRNRLEFCFIYNLIKYFYWPINPLAQKPMSRQTKADIFSLTR
ncbi:LuxR family transcriptional regulator [Serratia sp. M24T3]|nr:LuxR family transcriptional regulator [Serratia sp. M24T3]